MRCSKPCSPVRRIFPPEPTTRCQGTPRDPWRAQETWRADVPWRFDVLSQTLPFEGSTAQLPTAPGLGIEVDEKEAAKHPFQQEPLMRYFHPDGSVADW